MTPRIAVVDDAPDNRMLLDAILGDLFELTEFEDGISALEGMRASPPDLILLDISLPGMDGTEVVSAIRADPTLRGLPVIALTAHAMEGDRARFIAAGFDDYIAKPIVDEQLLLATIARGLAR